MSADDVGPEALVFQLVSCYGAGFGSNHLGFSLQCQRMHVLPVPPLYAVQAELESLRQRDARFLHGQGHQRVSALLCQFATDVQVLAWKSLVNKQDVHFRVWRSWTLRAAVSIRLNRA